MDIIFIYVFKTSGSTDKAVSLAAKNPYAAIISSDYTNRLECTFGGRREIYNSG